MKEIFDSYTKLLYSCFLYDINIFSQAWLYIPLLIPAFFYFVFMWFKWSFLFLPIWMPIYLSIKGLTGLFSIKVRDSSKNKIDEKRN